ncbi:hypothetical protein B0H13DRAFT_2581432 [Mycena leptocephala]|nr:hypothetical protein B0H13DRAFT_2581432 [Mycena leptocephala]
MQTEPRFIWATIQPSAVETVAHLDSHFATAAAQDTRPCQKYFALVEDCSQDEYFAETGFDWPFGDCVVSTSDPVLFLPSLVDSDMGGMRNPHVLPPRDSLRFAELSQADGDARMRPRVAEEKARKRRNDKQLGFLANGARHGRVSVLAALFRRSAGSYFSTNGQISALTRRSVLSVVDGKDYQMGVDDAVTQFGIQNQNTHRGYFILNDLNESIPDLTCPALVDFSAQFERPLSPDQATPPAPMEMTSEVPLRKSLTTTLSVARGTNNGRAQVASSPPTLDVPSVRVIYFDVYGTLIDSETGIFTALRPLLDRSPYEFDRHEALSFYFESEMEMKRRTPARAHDSPSSPSPTWTTIFSPYPAFASLAPFFEAVFTWDACRAYKPDPGVFDAPLRYYDALGVWRAHSFLVSGSLLRDLEPAREVGLPAVWVQCPGSSRRICVQWKMRVPGGFWGLFEVGVELLGVVGAPVIIRGMYEASNSGMDYNEGGQKFFLSLCIH